MQNHVIAVLAKNYEFWREKNSVESGKILKDFFDHFCFLFFDCYLISFTSGSLGVDV